MIKPLRKYHFVIWHSLAVLLPLCFVVAIVARPFQPSPLKVDDDGFSASIAPKTDSTDVVTIVLGHSITSPSCVVILSNQTGEFVLGTLSQQGVYSFVTRKVNGPGTLKLWDAINQRSIESIPLTEKK